MTFLAGFERGFDRGFPLRQLVLVATAWRGWQLDYESRRAVDRLVRAMLGPTTEGPVDAWLAVTGDGAVSAGDWVSGTRAQDGVEGFVDRLAAAAAPMDAADRERKITGARLRVLCGPARTDAVFPAASALDAGDALDALDAGTGAGTGHQSGSAGRGHWTALDVQFVSDRATRFQIHLGFSFWATRPPWHPEEVGDEPQPVDPATIPALRATFEARAATAARDLVDKHFGPTTTMVWRREHAPPMFWVATLARPRKNLSRYLDDPDIAERLVRPLLDRGPMDGGVAASIIDGNVLALRHFRQERVPPAGTGDAARDQMAVRPVYFLLLGRQPNRGNDHEPKDYRHQLVITSLTEFEARAATDMHEIDDDLQVWSTHVRVYDSVAEQAGTLWDALALHLPVRKGADLAATHRAIALVHQTLLQGVADLAEVESQVMDLTTKVDQLADELADLVHERLADRPPAVARHGVGESVAQASQLSRLRRHSEAVVADARRVKEQYKELLESIAHAFNERRVRELDVLQRGGHGLSLAVAVVTVVAVLDFVVEVKFHLDGSTLWSWAGRFALIGTSAGLGIGLMYVVIRNIRSVRKAQHITSSSFRRSYDKVLSYLRDSSTRELNRHPPAGKAAGDPARKDWVDRDHALATRFAALWDAATAGTPRAGSREHPPNHDIARLAADVEQWMLRALLLTERPRRLSRYRLPKLTLLYRHCVALERAKRWETTQKVVAEADLERTLKEEGYSLVEARAIDQRIGDLTRTRQRPTDASAPAAPAIASVAPATAPASATAAAVDLLRDIEEVLDSRTPARELDRVNRDFVRRAVGWLTDQGVRQFIDVGAGLPESDGVHVLAENAKVLYVDHAPEVVTQGQALLAEAGRTKFINADMVRDADTIIGQARGLFDFGEPMAVLFTRVFGYEPDENVRTTMEMFRTRLPAGAYIVISHVVAPRTTDAAGHDYVPTHNNGPRRERIRGRAEIHGFLDHLDPPAADPPGVPPPHTQKIHIAAGIGRVRAS
jgi:hypothetical protein